MNPFRLFRRSQHGSTHHPRQAHMTWAQTSMGRTVTKASVFLRTQLWVWPIIAIVVLSVVGLYVRGAIESTMKSNLESQLTTLVSAETAMLEKWIDVQSSNAELIANDPDFRDVVAPLLHPPQAEETDTSRDQLRHQVTETLGPAMSSQDFVGYFVANRDQKIVASSQTVLVGQQEIPEYEGIFAKVMDGKSLVSAPFASVVMLKDRRGRVRTGEPIMYAAAPIRDDAFQVIGMLALQLRPEEEFTEILQLGQIGDSGETYAFNSEGVMVSNSRFDEDLILLGVLPDHESSRSILNVHIRDPQGDMTEGYRPTVRRTDMPLTKMAEAAIHGKDGVDVAGYRDYRGVLVVGAWKWLPSYGLGVATEIDAAEAYLPLIILRRTVWGLYTLLVVSSIAIFVFTLLVARLQKQARKAAIEAQQLGQYSLEERLGAGAMGVVFRGKHAMLQRPTAIKLLDADHITDAAIERFEREVQTTCRLTHPSTVAIYDYGRTPEGVFYYAMEYLDGINLQQLVDGYGPQSPGRVIHILLQMCGSLYEAHSLGLVHRDIKPANIMLAHRGGEPDVVKVLDFGLVKAVASDPGEYQPENDGGLAGTPLYMSPEAIQSPMSVDSRSDLYSVGATGYFLLTGVPVFDAANIADLCQKHIDESPLPPSRKLGQPLSPELEHAILSCLEKSRSKRPQTARDLSQLLRHCPEAVEWSIETADGWWGRHHRESNGGQEHAGDTTNSSSQQTNYDQTIALDR